MKWLYLVTILLAPPPDAAPPTPAERIAELRQDCAGARAKLGTWAASKKLGRSAKAHFLLAVRLDPDCRRARQKLGHRKVPAGGWKPGREKSWEYGKGAMERHGGELRQREADLLRDEVTAFETLGVTLKQEGVEANLWSPLVLRALLLDPKREKAAKALGRAPLLRSFAVEEVCEAVRPRPQAADAAISGMLQSVLGARTIRRRCGSAVAEVPDNKAAADKLALVAHRAQALTWTRLDLPIKGIGVTTVFVARGKQQFDSFADRCGNFQGARLAAIKKVGSLRAFRPRHFVGSWVMPMGDPFNRAPSLVHMIAEDLLYQNVGIRCPAWLHEAVGIDACLTILGVPGPPCVVFEESAGLSMKDAFEKHEDWGRLLLIRAILGDLPHLEGIIRSQLQALGGEDIIAAHAYYRFFLLEHRKELLAFVKGCAGQEDPTDIFKQHFGCSPEEMEAEFLSVLTGE